MGVNIKYICDRCGVEEEHNNCRDVRITTSVITTNGSVMYNIPNKMTPKLWCKSCLSMFGLWIVEEKSQGYSTPPSLEDIIRELAGEAALEAIRKN